MAKIGMANIISGARIPLSLSLFLLPTEGIAFRSIYALCGLSDIADGYIARKSGTETELGSKLDSAADAVFVLTCFIKLFPRLSFKPYVWYWIALIAAMKIFSLILAYTKDKKFSIPHTTANKITGLMLFIFGFLIPVYDASFAAVPICAVATFAALQELIINKNHI